MATLTTTQTTGLRPSEKAMAIKSLVLAVTALALGACNMPNEPNLNAPNVSDFSSITTLAQVQNLVSGVLRGDRLHAENSIIEGEIIGRDLLNLTNSEDRWETQLLGPRVDPSGFLGGRIWPYGNIRLANIGIDGVAAAPAALLNAQDKPATLGFLQTLKALEYLRAIETRDTAGAPINVDIDPLAPPAPLSCKHDVLNSIAAQLDAAAVNLAAGGAAFPFSVPADFAGFDTPAGFLKFNRGLAAKTQVYLAFRNYAATAAIDAAALTAAQTALTASFMDSTKAIGLGPSHDYSTNTGDAQNSLFDGGPSSTTYFANQRVTAEADLNDARVSRKLVAGTPTTVALETGNQVYVVYAGPTSPTPLLTNKELMLLQAEVFWGQANYTGALAYANVLRVHDGGLAADANVTPASVLNRILYEKRYSLLFESGDRWYDARLFGTLNGSNPPAGIGTERTYAPIENIPLPFNEQSARFFNVTQTCTSGP